MVAYVTNSSGVIIPSEEMLQAVRELKAGEMVYLFPIGNDMVPFILGGVMNLTVVPGRRLRVGQVVLAESDCGLVLHRIVSIEGMLVTLMADASTFGQEHCLAKDVIGTVVGMQDMNSGRRTRLSSAWLWRKTMHIRGMLLGIWNLFHPGSHSPEGL